MIQVQLRRDTSVNWSSNNPVLATGEIGVVSDGAMRVFKMGDGITSWNSLGLIGDSVAQSAAAVADSKVVSLADAGLPMGNTDCGGAS